MIDEDEVRQMLSRRADSLDVMPMDTPTALRRARGRLLVNAAVAAVAAVVVVVTAFAGAHALRGAPVPARPTPSPSLAPDVVRANGEVLSFTGSWTPLAAQAFRDGVPLSVPGDLVAVNPETGEKRVLVEDLDSVLSAAWSDDGRWIAYEVAGFDGTELWVVGATHGPRQVAAGSLLWMWSSTGAELATIRLTSPLGANLAGSTISMIDPVTGETIVAGSIPEHVGDVTSAPVWSPDRTRFVFGARGGAIYSIDVRSGAGSLLVRLPGRHLDSVDRIAWSPDGAHIAVMNDLDPGDGRLYVMDADGSNIRVLLDQYDDKGVAWSPDGTRLAYRDGSAPVSVAPMNGSAPIEAGSPLPTSCDLFCQGGDLAWSPDGSQIGSRNAGDSVVVSAIDADGSGGEAERIDELTYRSWDGGSYSCGCR